MRGWRLGGWETRRHQTPVSSFRAQARNLPCRPINDGCVKAENNSLPFI
nr:MAG TPA: hypothetical protein [Caudoviricetes sp.]